MKEVVTHIHGRLEDNSRSFNFEVSKEKNVSRERHEFIEKGLSTLKESIELKVEGVYDLITSEVKKIGDLYYGVQSNVNSLISTMKTFLKDV